MPVTILIGAQWGDEGKGRVVDWLAAQSDLVGRYAGGDNAGHTVTLGDKTYKLHLIPSGILHHSVCILGHSMVVNPQRILGEIENLRQQGISISPENLVISERAHIITPAHLALDAAAEEARGDDAIGTTKRGIGPAYTDKVRRAGIQLQLMKEEEAFGDAIHAHVQDANQRLGLYGKAGLNGDEIASQYTEYARQLKPYIRNITPIIHDALSAGKRLLAEGAQGTMLDIDLGQYPFVTSSSPSVGGALSGLGFGPNAVDRVLGVTKAYSTRVGSGAMPTEQNNEIGHHLRGTGDKPWDEYGTTTGRPRRCGWLDVVALGYSAMVNGFTELALTKLDVLSGLDTLQIAIAYELDGQRLEVMPTSNAEIARVQPIYEILDGWHEDIMSVRRFADLPTNAQRYVERISELLNIPIRLISVGPEREQLILL